METSESVKKLLIFGLCGRSVFLTVDHFHRPEETLHASSIHVEPGGKGYNQAVMAARHGGARVVFVGAVGDDGDGRACEERLIAEGVESRLVRKDVHTAYACILTDRDGENRVTVYPGAAEKLTAEDVYSSEALFDDAACVLLTAEIPEEAFAAAAKLARKKAVALVINPAPWKEWLRSYLPLADYITPNRSEALSMLGIDDLSGLGEAVKLRFPRCNLIVTLGKHGARCFVRGDIFDVPAPAVRCVDSTGAGDTFNGVLCAALIGSMSVPDAAACAVRAASLSTEHHYVLG